MKKKRYQKPSTPAATPTPASRGQGESSARPGPRPSPAEAAAGPSAKPTFSVAGPVSTRSARSEVTAQDEDGAEPTASRTGFPVLAFALLAILIYWGDMFLVDQGGQFSAKVYSPYSSTNQLDDFLPKDETQIMRQNGQKVYGNLCAACHQPTGLGLAGQFPPLAGSDWIATEGPNRIIRLVLNGGSPPFIVNGGPYNGAMVPFRDTLTDADIAAVLTYVGNEWGNKIPTVAPDQVKKIRDLTKDKGGPWSMDDLKAVPLKD